MGKLSPTCALQSDQVLIVAACRGDNSYDHCTPGLKSLHQTNWFGGSTCNYNQKLIPFICVWGTGSHKKQKVVQSLQWLELFEQIKWVLTDLFASNIMLSVNNVIKSIKHNTNIYYTFTYKNVFGLCGLINQIFIKHVLNRLFVQQ